MACQPNEDTRPSHGNSRGLVLSGEALPEVEQTPLGTKMCPHCWENTG